MPKITQKIILYKLQNTMPIYMHSQIKQKCPSVKNIVDFHKIADIVKKVDQLDGYGCLYKYTNAIFYVNKETRIQIKLIIIERGINETNTKLIIIN